jgi:hypothetical protein
MDTKKIRGFQLQEKSKKLALPDLLKKKCRTFQYQARKTPFQHQGNYGIHREGGCLRV